jgi:hypothetical protein
MLPILYYTQSDFMINITIACCFIMSLVRGWQTFNGQSGWLDYCSNLSLHVLVCCTFQDASKHVSKPWIDYRSYNPTSSPRGGDRGVWSNFFLKFQEVEGVKCVDIHMAACPLGMLIMFVQIKQNCSWLVSVRVLLVWQPCGSRGVSINVKRLIIFIFFSDST